MPAEEEHRDSVDCHLSAALTEGRRRDVSSAVEGCSDRKVDDMDICYIIFFQILLISDFLWRGVTVCFVHFLGLIKHGGQVLNGFATEQHPVDDLASSLVPSVLSLPHEAVWRGTDAALKSVTNERRLQDRSLAGAGAQPLTTDTPYLAIVLGLNLLTSNHRPRCTTRSLSRRSEHRSV